MHDANEAYVRQLRVPEDATDDQIKEALTKLFQKNDKINPEGSVLKMPNKSIDQDQEQILDQYSSVPSRLSDQAQRSVQDQAKISVLTKGGILDVQFKKEVRSLLEKESPYMEILAELKEGRVEIKKNNEKFKIKRGMLVIHKDGQDTDLDYWRIIIPDSTSVKNLL